MRNTGLIFNREFEMEIFYKRERIGNRPQQFPTDFYIVSGASENLKPKVKDIIYQYF